MLALGGSDQYVRVYDLRALRGGSGGSDGGSGAQQDEGGAAGEGSSTLPLTVGHRMQRVADEPVSSTHTLGAGWLIGMLAGTCKQAALEATR